MKTPHAIALLVLGFGAVLAGCSSSPAAPVDSCVVEGCVERAGPIALEGEATALDVVQRAGPIEGKCDLSRVRLVRKSAEGEVSMQLNLAQMLEEGNSTFNVLVQPGDVLTVPAR